MYCLLKNEYIDLKIPYTTEMHKLRLLGYLDDNHNLTALGKGIVIEIEVAMGENKTSKLANVDDTFAANVAKYRELFPRGVVNGKTLRNGTTELTTRFLWFFKTYPQYTWDHVLNATQHYINSFGIDLTYCKTSGYFIKKEDKNKNMTSLLADWCEAELDEEREKAKPIIGFNKLV